MPHWLHPLSHWLSVHWGDVVPAWLAVIVAAIFGVQAWRSSRRSKAAEREAKLARDAAKAQADLATKAAQDAAAAATRSADAAERSATAHETQAQLMQDEATAAEQAPWRIENHGGMDYRLRNCTNTRKHDVAVTGEPAARPPGVFRMGGGDNQFDVVDGREIKPLDLLVHLNTQDRSVTVSWRPTTDHTGDPWTQHISLP